MRIIAAAALIASSFTPIAFPLLVAVAAADPVDGSYCNLPMSASSGWTCDQQVTSATYYSDGQATVNGGDLQVTCQDYVQTTADYAGINPHGRRIAAFSATGVTTDEPLGGPYDGTNNGCNYPPR